MIKRDWNEGLVGKTIKDVTNNPCKTNNDLDNELNIMFTDGSTFTIEPSTSTTIKCEYNDDDIIEQRDNKEINYVVNELKNIVKNIDDAYQESESGSNCEIDCYSAKEKLEMIIRLLSINS